MELLGTAASEFTSLVEEIETELTVYVDYDPAVQNYIFLASAHMHTFWCEVPVQMKNDAEYVLNQIQQLVNKTEECI